MENNNTDSAAGGLVEWLHAAIEDNSRWAAFLGALRRAGGGRAAMIYSDGNIDSNGVWAQHGLSDEAARQWKSQYRHWDPWLKHLTLPARGNHLLFGAVADTAAPVMPQEFRERFLQPNRLGSSLGVWIRADAARAEPYCLRVWLDNRTPDFAPGFREQFVHLIGVLERFERIGIANCLSRTVRTGQRQSASFLLNGRGAIVIADENGAAMIDSGLVVDNPSHIALRSAAVTSWIRERIRGHDANPFLPFPQERQEILDGHGTFGFEFAPLTPIGAGPTLMGVRYGLTVWRLGEQSAQIAELAQQRYRWTEAEIEIVRRLTEGQSVSEIARERECSIETVRSHLKNAKRKAGVNRQVDLVRLMLSLQSGQAAPDP